MKAVSYNYIDCKFGLEFSYDIIKANGGDIKVETKENIGSIFIIQLPIN